MDPFLGGKLNSSLTHPLIAILSITFPETDPKLLPKQTFSLQIPWFADPHGIHSFSATFSQFWRSIR